MQPFQQQINEYRKQLEKGTVKEAYRGLMEYFDGLRLHLQKKHPDYFLSGSVHHGFMDYTYFYFFPKTLKQRRLKIVILFIHDTFKFEVWLAGYNKKIQQKYWKLFKENNWNNYHLASTTKEVDSIIDYTLIDNTDFSDLEALTKKIETGTLKFIEAIESFLSKNSS